MTIGQILQLVLSNLLVSVLLGATIYSAVRRVHYHGDMSKTNPQIWFWGLILGSFALLMLANHETLW